MYDPAYARTAYSILFDLYAHHRHGQGTLLPLPDITANHTICSCLLRMQNTTPSKTVAVLRQMSVAQLNARGPVVNSASILWDVGAVRFVIQCITSYLNIVWNRHAPAPSRAERRLSILKFVNAGLDKVDLNRILHLPEVVDKIPEEFRDIVGVPLVAFKYGHSVSRTFHNVKEYANMSPARLDGIKHSRCGCRRIDDSLGFKVNGHLLTSDPNVFPPPGLIALAEMGGKYRPGGHSNTFDADSKAAAVAAVTQGIGGFVERAERRTGSHGCLASWKAEVLLQVEQSLDRIPYGSQMAVVPPLPFTLEDQAALRRFLSGYIGCGVVCTSLDEAANTLIVQCPWDYVTRITDDLQNLDVKGTYVIVDRPVDEIVASHNAFLQAFLQVSGSASGIRICRDIPPAPSCIRRTGQTCASYAAQLLAL